MNSKEIRSKFLNFFSSRGHKICPSAHLVTDDPTLLFNNSGMAPLKEYFFKRKNDMSRAVTIQKCLRTVDLETVGHTSKHHTFFEMLGNFSFGDYFKREACAWAWEFLIKDMGIPKKDIWISIYKGDDTALQIWHEIGILNERIVEMEENFWAMGETGPCGPCSEIIVDRGPDKGCGKSNCSVSCDCDRFLELWNLVFTQFDRKPDGKLVPLSQKNIDTGMGLERLTSLLQGVDGGFETDLFKPVLDYLVDKYNLSSDESSVSLRIVSDHVRAATFLIGEGIHPSNESRGYVLRRILRRAVRHGKSWDNQPFLYKLSPIVVESMRDVYPELVEKREYISKVILEEENNFSATLNQGVRMMDEIIAQMKKSGKTQVPGKDVFKLYDTYGFPVELIKEIALEQGFNIDEDEYRKEMEKQRSRSRSSREKKEFTALKTSGAGVGTVVNLYGKEYEPIFKVETEVKAIFRNDNKEIPSLKEGEDGIIVLQETCFYAQSGGQVGDTGRIFNESTTLEVTDTQNFNLHKVKVIKGEIKTGDKVSAEVDSLRRSFIARHHSATHLLQASLRQVLGSHIEQRGSLVSSDYLRFDFTHFPIIKKEELDKIEEIVNEKITANLEVRVVQTTLARAKEMGALAIFQEKYDEENVRVVSIGEPPVSRELCGGTHVEKTGEIGLFKITGCEGIAKGIRRIEAACGWPAYLFTREQFRILSEISAAVNLPADKLSKGIKELIENKKMADDSIKHLRNQIIQAGIADLIDKKEEIKGVSIISGQIENASYDSLMHLYELIEKNTRPIIAIFGAILDNRAVIVGRASKELKERIHLGQIMKEISKIIQGGGGGKTLKAQAQGTEKTGIHEAINKARELIKEQLKKGYP